MAGDSGWHPYLFRKSETVMDSCQDYGWEYTIRYKTGSIPSITEEYGWILETGRAVCRIHQ